MIIDTTEKNTKRQQVSESQLAEYHRKLAIYEEQMKSDWEDRSYNEFLDLVTNCLDPGLDYEHPVCPFCNCEKVRKEGHRTTLVGSIGDIDLNHQWVECVCEKCDERWTMEYKGQYERGYNVWYTKEGKVLRGLPTCFESYRYTCKHCSGDVNRHYYDKDTRDTAKILSYSGDGVKYFDTYFRCDQCDVEVECSNEYYSYDTPHRPWPPFDPRKTLGWVIREEVGIVIVNDYAISRIEVGGK